MNKERLGFDIEIEMKHLKKILNKDDSLTISSRFVKYLIEQAERVPELERVNKQLKNNLSVYKGYYNSTLKHNKELVEQVQELEEANKKNYWIASDFKFENLNLEQQNKRYREAIDYVMTAKTTHYSSLENALEDIKFVINETLEESP